MRYIIIFTTIYSSHWRIPCFLAAVYFCCCYKTMFLVYIVEHSLNRHGMHPEICMEEFETYKALHGEPRTLSFLFSSSFLLWTNFLCLRSLGMRIVLCGLPLVHFVILFAIKL